jgi:hypothetical protein
MFSKSSSQLPPPIAHLVNTRVQALVARPRAFYHQQVQTSFLRLANQPEETAAGWLHLVFSVIQPTSATYCTPRKNSGASIGGSSASILPSTSSSQLSTISQPAGRNGRRLAPLSFLSHPASICHLLHAS